MLTFYQSWVNPFSLRRWPNIETTLGESLVFAGDRPKSNLKVGWLCLLYKPNELLVIKIHGECYNHGKTLDTLFTFSVSDKLYFKIKIIPNFVNP